MLFLRIFLTPHGITSQPVSSIQGIMLTDGIDVNLDAFNLKRLVIEDVEHCILLHVGTAILQEDVEVTILTGFTTGTAADNRNLLDDKAVIHEQLTIIVLNMVTDNFLNLINGVALQTLHLFQNGMVAVLLQTLFKSLLIDFMEADRLRHLIVVKQGADLVTLNLGVNKTGNLLDDILIVVISETITKDSLDLILTVGILLPEIQGEVWMTPIELVAVLVLLQSLTLAVA